MPLNPQPFIAALNRLASSHGAMTHSNGRFSRLPMLAPLPPASSPLLTRELLYTAVTRAKEHVRIIGTREALVTAVERPIARASGLRVRPSS